MLIFFKKMTTEQEEDKSDSSSGDENIQLMTDAVPITAAVEHLKSIQERNVDGKFSF